MNVLTLVLTFFLVMTPVFAFNETQNATINAIANATNLSISELQDLFLSLENQVNTTNLTLQLNLSGYATNDSIALIENRLQHNIDLVNASVDNGIVTIIAAFRENATNESFVKVMQRLNDSFSSYDTTVNERLQFMRNNYIPEKITDATVNLTSDLTNIAYANDKLVLDNAYGASNFDKILMLILFGITMLVFFKFKKPVMQSPLGIHGRPVAVGAEKLSIEDISNPEYQKNVREAYNLIVKINAMKIPEELKKKAFARVWDGTITKDNLENIINGIGAEERIPVQKNLMQQIKEKVNDDTERPPANKDRQDQDGEYKEGRRSTRKKGR